MPAAVAGFAIWVASAVGGGAAVAAFVFAATKVILLTVALGAISRELVKKPSQNVPPVNVTVRNPTENRRLVFGSVRVGGSFLFFDVSGDKNKYLWYVIAVAGHQVEAIRDVWLDTQKIANADIGGGDAGGGEVDNAAFFDGKVFIWKLLGGSSQTVQPDLNDAFAEWTTAHRCRGIALIVVRMEHDEEQFPQGPPQSATALVDGARCYDPRLDSNNGGSGTHRRGNPLTWEFTRNPILHARHVLSGGSVHHDSSTRLRMYGLKEENARIPDSYFRIAADICDETLTGSVEPPDGPEPRYCCDIELSTGETPREWLEDILATCAGTLVNVHGQHRIYAGAYREPIHAFTEKDLYGALEIEDTFDHRRRYNQVAAVFRASDNAYEESTTKFRRDSAYVTQDGDREIPIEILLRGVTSRFQAERLAEIKLRQSRMMRSVNLTGALNLMRVAPYDNLTYTHARFGWAVRTFTCRERKLDLREGAGTVVLTCTREDEAVWNDLLTADYETGLSDTDTFQNEEPYPPVALQMFPEVNGFRVQITPPEIEFPGTRYQGRISASKTMSSPTLLDRSPDHQFTVARTSTANAFIQVRAVRNGQFSDWYPPTEGMRSNAREVAAVLSATVAPGAVESRTGAASQTTPAAVVTAAGGTAPYTYAWAFEGGTGSGITITSNTSASTTFSATALTQGQLRTGRARCTVTDSTGGTPQTFVVEVDVEIERPNPTVRVRPINLYSSTTTPTQASAAFTYDADGHVYTSITTGAPATDHGLWCDPADYAPNYQIRVTRTGGTETAFTSGTNNVWQTLTTDRTWRLTDTNIIAPKDIEFTIEIRRLSDSVVEDSETDNTLSAEMGTDQ
jgi:hypothetical protein